MPRIKLPARLAGTVGPDKASGPTTGGDWFSWPAIPAQPTGNVSDWP